MPDFPAMPLWTDAYLADTRHLSHAEHGRYLLMLMDMWRMPEKRFPNDDAWLARKFRCTENEVENLFRPLIREFFQNDGNWICQKRLMREWHRLKKTTQRQSENAKSRWAKGNSGSHGSATVAMQPQPYTPKEESKRLESHTNVVAISPKPQPGTSIVASAKPRRPQRYPGEFEAFWSSYPQRPTDTKKLACANWQKAVTSGVDPPTLQAGAERYAAFVGRTGHESMLVQTWINRQGWTASYAGNNGCGNGKASIIERVAGRLRAEGQDLFGPDGPVVESREAEWRGRRH